MKVIFFFFAVLVLFSFISCNKKEDPVLEDPVLTINTEAINFYAEGGNVTVTVTMNGSSWTLISDQDWCTVSTNTSSMATGQVVVSATANEGQSKRTATLTFVMDEKHTKTVMVSQDGQEPEAPASIYPNYGNSIEPDETGMASNAAELAAKIKLGWNLGNTLEAIGGETAWGNPKASKALIDQVKASGFNAVRIPCSWNQNSNPSTAEIQQVWLNRVKEVVQYCVDNDMYVLLNIHWDGGWLENNCTPEKKDAVNAKQKAFWQQIATHLRDFDEHLMFASANEPHVEDAIQMEVLNSYHQTFIDAVRATGGRNSYRTLVIQGPATNIGRTNTLMTTLPTDEAVDRFMMEVHYYDPWQFAGLTEDASWGTRFYYWGEGNHSTTDTDRNPAWGEEDFVDEQFQLMKAQFVDKGIPVILGEYGAIRRTSYLEGDALALHLASRAYYIKYVTQSALANGILPFYWDEGSLSNHGFGFINRSNNTVGDQLALDAVLEGAGQ